MVKNTKTTKEKILDGARKLFSRRGFDSTSMAEIATVCGIQKGSLYYFFKNKEHIFSDIIHDVIGKITLFLSEYKGGKETFSALIEETINISLNDSLLVRMSDESQFPCKPHLCKEMVKGVATMKEHLERILRGWSIREPELAVEVVLNAVHSYVIHSKSSGRQRDKNEYAEYLAKIISNNK
jgi:AcrR family transcriptional regulator